VVKIENILFATDFSEDSGYALTYARTLAELCNTRLYIFHVDRESARHLYGEPHGEYPALEANAIKKVHELMIHRFDDVLSGFTQLRAGRPRWARRRWKFLKMAEEKHAGAIVMGTHGGARCAIYWLAARSIKPAQRDVPVMVSAIRAASCLTIAERDTDAPG